MPETVASSDTPTLHKRVEERAYALWKVKEGRKAVISIIGSRPKPRSPLRSVWTPRQPGTRRPPVRKRSPLTGIAVSPRICDRTSCASLTPWRPARTARAMS